jgi:hypothetical protein
MAPSLPQREYESMMYPLKPPAPSSERCSQKLNLGTCPHQGFLISARTQARQTLKSGFDTVTAILLPLQVTKSHKIEAERPTWLVSLAEMLTPNAQLAIKRITMSEVFKLFLGCPTASTNLS